MAEVHSAVVSTEPVANYLAAFPGLDELSADPGLIATNVSLAIGSLLVVLAAATLFNATLKENAGWFEGMFGRLPKPSLTMLPLGVPAGALGRRLPQFTFAYTVVLIAGTAVIYSALDPHFGFNDTSLVLVLALMAGVALSTFLYEGAQVFLSKRAFGVPAAVKAFPIAILIAATSVGLSRVVHLNPGVIFGFVAAAALAPQGIGHREVGITVFLSMLGLLVVSLIALALISPFRTLAEGSSSVWASMPETIAVAVFVGGAESMLLMLIPLTFTDGQKVWRWSRRAWLGLAVPATFLFFHVIANRSGTFGSTDEPGAVAPVAVALGFLLVAAILWAFFRLRTRDHALASMD